MAVLNVTLHRSLSDSIMSSLFQKIYTLPSYTTLILSCQERLLASTLPFPSPHSIPSVLPFCGANHSTWGPYSPFPLQCITLEKPVWILPLLPSISPFSLCFCQSHSLWQLNTVSISFSSANQQHPFYRIRMHEGPLG